jgi:hypothetical protein
MEARFNIIEGIFILIFKNKRYPILWKHVSDIIKKKKVNEFILDTKNFNQIIVSSDGNDLHIEIEKNQFVISSDQIENALKYNNEIIIFEKNSQTQLKPEEYQNENKKDKSSLGRFALNNEYRKLRDRHRITKQASRLIIEMFGIKYYIPIEGINSALNGQWIGLDIKSRDGADAGSFKISNDGNYIEFSIGAVPFYTVLDDLIRVINNQISEINILKGRPYTIPIIYYSEKDHLSFSERDSSIPINVSDKNIDHQILVDKGITFFSRGKSIEAITMFDRVLLEDPGHTQALYWKSHVKTQAKLPFDVQKIRWKNLEKELERIEDNKKKQSRKEELERRFGLGKSLDELERLERNRLDELEILENEKKKRIRKEELERRFGLGKSLDELERLERNRLDESERLEKIRLEELRKRQMKEERDYRKRIEEERKLWNER